MMRSKHTKRDFSEQQQRTDAGTASTITDEYLFNATELAQASPCMPPPPSREWLTQQSSRLELSETARLLIVAAGIRGERRGNWLVYCGSANELVEDVGVTDRHIRRSVRQECEKFGVLRYVSDRSSVRKSLWMIDMGILINGIPAPQTPAIVRAPVPVERQQNLFVQTENLSPPVPTRPDHVPSGPGRSSLKVRSGVAAVLHVLAHVLTGWRRRPDRSSPNFSTPTPMSPPVLTGPHHVLTGPGMSSEDVLTGPDPCPDRSSHVPTDVLTPLCNASPSPPSLSYLSKTPPPSESSGDGTSKKLIWGRTLQLSELQDPESLLDLFEIVVMEGFAVLSEQDELKFFALVAHILRQSKIVDKIGFLTKTIDGRCKDRFGRDWRARPANIDEQVARNMLKKLKHGEEVAPLGDSYVTHLQEAAHQCRVEETTRAKLQADARELLKQDWREGRGVT